MAENPGQGCVVIVDDDEGIRQSLKLLFETAGWLTRTHATGEEFLDCGPPVGPACLLLDLRMPGASGIEIQKRLQKDGWEVPVIFLTGHADVPVAVEALKGGALDFFEKTEFDHRRLLERITQAIESHRQQLKERSEQEQLQARIETLSERELEVARLAAGGEANKVIGLELGISERTVEVHRGRAMKKLGLRTAAELVRLEPQLDKRGD